MSKTMSTKYNSTKCPISMGNTIIRSFGDLKTFIRGGYVINCVKNGAPKPVNVTVWNYAGEKLASYEKD